jgi:glycerophosphoryl diester phosphodiesterase
MLSIAIAHNIPVLCYTVNEQGQARELFDRGVSGLFTDRLDVFMSETQAYKGLHLVR